MAWTMLERYQAKTPNFKRYSLKVIQKKLDCVKERREADVCVNVKKAKGINHRVFACGHASSCFYECRLTAIWHCQ